MVWTRLWCRWTTSLGGLLYSRARIGRRWPLPLNRIRPARRQIAGRKVDTLSWLPGLMLWRCAKGDTMRCCPSSIGSRSLNYVADRSLVCLSQGICTDHTYYVLMSSFAEAPSTSSLRSRAAFGVEVDILGTGLQRPPRLTVEISQRWGSMAIDLLHDHRIH